MLAERRSDVRRTENREIATADAKRGGHGSTSLHLAGKSKGRSGSGSDGAKAEQGRLIGLLLAHGARPTDADATGKTVAAAASGTGSVTCSASGDGFPAPEAHGPRGA